MATLPQSQEVLTVEQVAEELKLTPQTIRNWIKTGLLPAVQLKHVFRITRQDLDDVLSQQRSESGSLGTHRDPWAPETLGSPVRPRDSKRKPSVWDGTSDRIVPTKRQ
jgi:excisionase family DNA binding protein